MSFFRKLFGLTSKGAAKGKDSGGHEFKPLKMEILEGTSPNNRALLLKHEQSIKLAYALSLEVVLPRDGSPVLWRLAEDESPADPRHLRVVFV